MRIAKLCRALRVLGLAAAGVAFCPSRAAHATTILEFPDNGSEQMARGGAWVARASDPLATFYNPAGLAGQDTKVTLQANINIQKTCFTRVKGAHDTVKDGYAAGSTYPEACTDGKPFPDPQIGFTYKVSDRVGIGFAVLGPSASGKQTWPNDPNSANRYLLVSADALLFFPTIGIGAEVARGFRLGLGLSWGIASFELSNVSLGLNTPGLSPRLNDIDAKVKAKDLFVPAVTGGVLWSPSSNLDVAGWYKWTDTIKASGDATTNFQGVTGDTSLPNCGNPSITDNRCGSGNNAHLEVPIPMEAKIGARFHMPRAGADANAHRRDPLSQDVFDAEINLTWANDSAFDYLKIRFPGDADQNGTILVNGLPGYLPPNADVRHHYKDVVGLRLGGDYNVLPDQLAVRAGVFYETNGQDPQYQNIDFAGAARFGFALGGTYRLRLSQEKTSALEFSAGFGHVFVSDQSRTDPNASGLTGLAGTPCATGDVPKGPNCADGQQKYRTNWPVNLGTITNSFNAINVGVAYRF